MNPTGRASPALPDPAGDSAALAPAGSTAGLLAAVTRIARLGQSARDGAAVFLGAAEAMAELLGGKGALFASAAGGKLSIQPNPYGIAPELCEIQIACTPELEGLPHDIVFRDQVFSGTILGRPEFASYEDIIRLLGAPAAIAVPWKDGATPQGLVCVWGDSIQTSADAAAQLKMLAQVTNLALASNREKERMLGAISSMEKLEVENQAFMRLMTHEINAPLSVISGYLEMLQQGMFGQGPAEWNAPLALVQTKTRELVQLIDEMSLCLRIDRGTLSPRQAAIDLDEAVTGTVANWEEEFASSGGSIVWPSAAQPIVVKADRTLLPVILGALLSNALGFGGNPPTAHITVAREESMGVVRIADNGAGVAEAVLPKMFDRFFRGQLAHRKGGSGLGLYLGRALAVAMGGSLSLESTGPEGSTFVLKLPLFTS